MKAIMKPIKLELPPDHLDIVMKHLLEGKMKDVNNTVNLIMQQANDPVMQGGAVAADSKSGESVAEPGATSDAGQATTSVPTKRKR